MDSYRNIRRSSAAPALPLRLSKENSSDENSTSVYVTFTKDEKERLTPYEKLLYESEYDVRVHAEEKAGRRIGFYRLRGNIGLGNFSKVKLAVHLLAREKVAVKILDRRKLNSSTQKLLLREIKTIERLHHPNIIRLYEVIETPNEYFIVTEYAPGGELYTRISSGGKLNETQAKLIFAQLTAAVDHMHGKGVVHRDIKGENIFFLKENFIKLGDFGFSTFSEKNQMLSTFCGSPPYAAPELYRDENYNGFAVDMWAMGVLLYFIVTGLMPFRGENLAKLRKTVLNGFYSIPGHVSSECEDLIRGLLQPDSTERWTIKQVRSSSWLNKEKFAEPLEPLPLSVTNVWTCQTEDSTQSNSRLKTPTKHSTSELEAHQRLKDLGITNEVLEKAAKYSRDKLLSNGNSINGTFRLIFHRLQKQSNPFERDDQFLLKNLDDETPPSYNRVKSMNDVVVQRKDQQGKRRRASYDAGARFPDGTNSSQACTIL